MHLGWLLDRFLEDFGVKLGVKLEPSWHQNRRKWGTKTMSKNHQKSGAAVVRSGPQVNLVLAPKNILSQGPQGTEGKTWALGTLPYRARGPGADTFVEVP